MWKNQRRRKMLKVKNLGNSFRTITSGELPKDGTTMIAAWEAFMWLKNGKQIEIIEEEKPKTKKKKK